MTETADLPYPIQRLFRTRVVPVLILSGLLLLGGGWVSVNSLEQHVYLETTQRRVETTIDLAERAEPEFWNQLLSGADPSKVLADPAAARAVAMLEAVSKDGHALQLKIFNARGVTIYSTDAADWGVREENTLLRQVLDSKMPALETSLSHDQKVYELYIPTETNGQTLAFEVYEPASVLDEIIADSFIQFAILPVSILLVLGIWLARITRNAQVEIDSRVQMQQSLRRQLERFVSQSAGMAARQSPDGSVPITRSGMTLFYSDVRDFTSLAEFHPPKATVDFLNELMTRQVEAVTRHGGDVDKMIGDALLVRFEGADREARALLAAQEILADLAAHPMARGIGIGVHDGEAILGPIGPAERQDFTVIGDSVNLAARLCALAGDGQLVVDELALRRSGLPDDGFGEVEDQQVKGRTAQVRVRRWSPG
ncbi:adenylate/guanylate cyclase domain-containing protein [Magnetospirillum sp. 64-120]|uniref:adenylate/guanylate cyclase domain-containing protein n=1 Tax=Magnetospirillum sp. 64-120 TaxID=1895778 RepID=UPI000A47B16A|nr:adenylate/guanylate cyclase domain-containing protein [Magnetospirillum sp. 64-120]